MDITDIITQMWYFPPLILAGLCGGLIGMERQQRTKVAGIKTHIMISIAACLMMIISKYGFFDVAGQPGLSCDVSRVAAGIISGVAILGGGIIFIGKQGYVTGITTAAGLWDTIGIGMAIGAKMYVLGTGATLIILFIQYILHKNVRFAKQPMRMQVEFNIDNDKNSYNRVIDSLGSFEISLNQFKWIHKSKNSSTFKCQIVAPAGYTRDDVVSALTSIPELDTFEII